MEITLEAIISFIGLFISGGAGAFFTWKWQQCKAKAEAETAEEQAPPTVDLAYVRTMINGGSFSVALGELCREYEGPSAKADVFIGTWLLGEPFESVNRYLDIIRTATSEDFMRIAQQYLSPENMIEVVAGA